jgi:hypothetical protein
MGLIGDAIISVVVATISRLVADDLKAWAPKVIERLMTRAVSKLPDRYRERLQAEWQAHLSETPGDIGKLKEALEFNRAARVLRLAERQRLLHIQACETRLRQIESKIAIDHFSKWPHSLRALAMDAFRARARSHLEARHVGAADFEALAYRLALELRTDIRGLYEELAEVFTRMLAIADTSDMPQDSFSVDLPKDLVPLVNELITLAKAGQLRSAPR